MALPPKPGEKLKCTKMSLHNHHRVESTYRVFVLCSMRQPARFALLIVLGAVCWCLAWLGKGRHRNKEHNNDNARSHFRLSDVVDEALKSRLYDSLSLLEQSLRRHANTEWPQFIWQTSPTQGDTREMNSWKIRNPEWNHRVFSLL